MLLGRMILKIGKGKKGAVFAEFKKRRGIS
jgi:hypothetical protein